MKNYVLGFIFNKSVDEVCLILKNRPYWQSGLYNGIGGHIEEGETPIQAIARESKEETGFEGNNWELILQMKREGEDSFLCHVFRCISEYNSLSDICKTMEDQEVEIFSVNNLPKNIISNLKWLINICIDKNNYSDSYIFSGEIRKF